MRCIPAAVKCNVYINHLMRMLPGGGARSCTPVARARARGSAPHTARGSRLSGRGHSGHPHRGPISDLRSGDRAWACAHAPHRRIGPESCLLDLAAGAGLPAWRPTCSPPAVQHHLHPARARGATRPPWPLHPGAWCCVCVRWCDPTAHPHPRERRAGDNVRHHSVALWPRNLTPIGPRVE